MSEKNIQTEIMLALSKLGVTIFRNNTGNGVAGSQMKRIEKPCTMALLPGDWIVRHGSRIQYGLCVGSSDTIGWRPVTITPDMVGETVAVFTAVEIKTSTGRATPEQVNFIEAVRKAGGIAGVARSVDDLNCLLFPLKTTNQ